MAKRSIASFDISPVAGIGASPTLRLAADVDFVTGEGDLVPAGDHTRNYRTITPAVAGSVLTVPTVADVDTTDDSSNPNATYSLYLVDGNSLVRAIFERWAVSAAYSSPLTFADLETYNVNRVPLRDDQAFSKHQTILEIESRLSVGNPAATTSLGRVKITPAPADASSPIAVGDNDPGIVAARTATAANTASAVVRRDASGNFSAGTITAALNGNAATATTATAVVGATPSSTPSAVVIRDGDGDFDGREVGVRSGIVHEGTAARAFGDSQTASPRTWFDTLCALKGWTPTNSAVGGAMAPDVWGQVYPVSVSATANQQFLPTFGFNDAHVYGPDLAYKNYFRLAHLASLAWLALPDSQKVKITDLTRWRFTGAWTLNSASLYGGITSHDRYTSTNGDYAEIDFTGGRTLLLWFNAQITGTRNVEVRVDGVLYGTYSLTAPSGGSSGTGSALTANGINYAPQLIALAGLQDKAHTVRITNVSPTGSPNFVHVIAAASVGGARSTGAPSVYAGGIVKVPAAFYSLGSPISTTASEGTDSDYDRIIRENCERAAAWGLQCSFVDLRGPIDPATDIGADNIHLNAQFGDPKVVAAFAERTNSLAWPDPPAVVRRLKGKLTQSGTNAPVLTVVGTPTLDGTPVPSYAGVGDYYLTLAGAFPAGTSAYISQFPAGGPAFLSIGRANDNQIEVKTWNTSGAAANGLLTNAEILIEVEP